MVSEYSLIRCKTIGRSIYEGRKGCDLETAAAHNLRDFSVGKGGAEHIDPSKCHLNVILQGARTAKEVVQAAEVLWEGVKRPNRKDRVQALEAIFCIRSGVTPEGHESVRAYFESCLLWLKLQMASMPVVSAVIHYDEEHPHMHVLILPIQGGESLGGKPIHRKPLRVLTDKFFEEVAGPAGFERAKAKLYGHLKKRGIEAVLSRCEAMGVRTAYGPVWAPIQASIERDPTPFVIALGIDLSPVPSSPAKTDRFQKLTLKTETYPV